MSTNVAFSRLPPGSPLDTLTLDAATIERLVGAATTPEDEASVLQFVEDTLPFMSPARFAAKADPTFMVPPHIAFLDKVLEDLVCGRLGVTKIIVTMPPRHGKSELCSKFLPAWFLCRYPDRRVILTSYQDTFARDWGRKAREVVEESSDWTGIRIRQDSKAADHWNVVGHKGGMQTAGAGGPVTGKGAHLFIIDDPVKNAQDANSQVVRQSTWDWYISTAKTRLEPGAFQVVIMTRWHEDDLVGRLLLSQPDQWRVINFPAIAEEEDELGRKPGDALWPGAYPIEALEEIRDTPETSYWWGALYQQHPTTEDGGMFARADFRYWELSGDGSTYICDDGFHCPVINTIRFQTIDLAASKRTKADYTVIATWAITKTEPAHLLLLDRFRGRIEAPEHLAKIEELYYAWSRGRPKVRFAGVGKHTYGLAVLQEAARKGDHWLRPEDEDTDKYSRAIPASQLVKAHVAHFPRRCSWLDEWERELLAFDNGAHDDQVDVFSLAALEFGKRRKWAPAVRVREPEDTEAQIMKQLQRQRRQKNAVQLVGGGRTLALHRYRRGV